MLRPIKEVGIKAKVVNTPKSPQQNRPKELWKMEVGLF